MKNLSTTSERHIALAADTLTPSTLKPKIPSDRQPKLYQLPRKSNDYLVNEFLKAKNYPDENFKKLQLYKSLIIMIGSFLERSPEASKTSQPTLRKFINHMEICLGLRAGKLNPSQYGKVLVWLYTLAPFKDGELTKDLEALDAIVHAYGNKLAS